MIDSTPTPSGAVVDQRSARTPQPVVEADAGGEAEEARQDALAQPGHGTRPVAFQGEQVLAGPEDRLDALADGGEVRAVAWFVLARRAHHGGAQLGAGCGLLICDKGYAGREFAAAVAELGATVVRPARKDEPGRGPHLAPIRQRIESIFWTCKDLLTLERHGARTVAGLRERILTRFLCLAACISLNHRLGRPSRALVDYCA